MGQHWIQEYQYILQKVSQYHNAAIYHDHCLKYTWNFPMVNAYKIDVLIPDFLTTDAILKLSQ